MALPASGVWEVRASGGDDANNAGLYDPAVAGAGTDFSITDPTAFTDLVVDATTNTKVTSATIGFASAHVGNSLRITSSSPWTAGVYNIRSVAAGVATLDRSPAAVNSASGTGRLGGALASPGQCAGLKVAGNVVWIKSGTYSIGSGTANTSGSRVNDTQADAWWQGYGTTRGDGARPVLAAGVNSITLMVLSGARAGAADLEVVGTGRTAIIGLDLGGVVQLARNVLATDCAGTAGIRAQFAATLEGCWARGCATGLLSISGAAALIGCVATACTTYGISCGAGTGGFAARCVVSGTTGGPGFYNNSGTRLIGCTSYGNSNAGFSLAANLSQCYGCVAAGNGTYGFDLAAGLALTRLTNCAGYSNTSGHHNAPVAQVSGFVTLSANPFTSAAGLDFTLNSTAGGGAALRAAGWPATLPGLAGTSYPDIGAYQSQGGGIGAILARIFTGY